MHLWLHKNRAVENACRIFARAAAQNSRKIHEEIFRRKFASFWRATPNYLSFTLLRQQQAAVCNPEARFKTPFACNKAPFALQLSPSYAAIKPQLQHNKAPLTLQKESFCSIRGALLHHQQTKGSLRKMFRDCLMF